MRKASSQESTSQDDLERDEPPRDRHGFRGTPPPPPFSLAALPDDALLSEIDVAAILRMSSNTVASWRSQPAHPLRWFTLPNGFVRYQVSDIRAFLAMGRSRARKPRSNRAKIKPPKPAATAPRRRAAKSGSLSNGTTWSHARREHE